MAEFWSREGLHTGDFHALRTQVAELSALAECRLAEREELERLLDHIRPSITAPTWDDLSDTLDDERIPPLDRRDVDLATLNDDQRHWSEQGYLIKRNFIPYELLDSYFRARAACPDPGGWTTGTPYLHVPEVLDLAAYRPLIDLLEQLIGEPMAVSLNLTGLVSTERNWHQDEYLNAPSTRAWYAAVWFAIGDVDPDSGPFQYVPGSHRWPCLRRERVRMYLAPEERNNTEWPKLTERFINDLAEDQIRQRKAQVETFLAHKGDVLIWHARLLHRGSPPAVPGRRRLGFISHYHGVNHFATGPKVGQHRNGGMYWLGEEPLAPVS